MTPEQTRTIRENMVKALPFLKAAHEAFPKLDPFDPYFMERVGLGDTLIFASGCEKALARQAALESAATAASAK